MQLPIAVLLLTSMIRELGYSLIPTLVPFIGKEKGISESYIGIIFSSFTITNFTVIILTPMIINYCGKKKALTISIIFEGFSTILFGLLYYINTKPAFIIFGIIIRLIQGGFGAIISTLLYSLVAGFSTQEMIQRNIGLLEIVGSLSFVIGPIIGSAFFHYFGYAFPFVAFALLEFGVFVVIKKNFNAYIFKKDKAEHLFSVFIHPQVIFVFVAEIIQIFAVSFIFPSLGIYLTKTYNYEQEKASLFFTIPVVVFLPSVLFVNMLIDKLGHSHKLIIVGLCIKTVCIPLIPPMLLLPQSIVVIVIGLIGFGLSSALISIPSVLVLIETLEKEAQFEKDTAQDYASAIYNLGYILGETLGPLIGGLIMEAKGFRGSLWVDTFISTLFTITYMIFLTYQSRRQKAKETPLSNMRPMQIANK